MVLLLSSLNSIMYAKRCFNLFSGFDVFREKVVDSVASVIVTSTVMSFITIPIVVYLSLKYFQ